jgi:hypothetical protein
MKLLTKEVVKNARKNYELGSTMEQKVVAKFFDPQSSWKWYLMNMEDESGSYCWGIVKGVAVEVGSFSAIELMEYRSPWGLKIERDLNWTPMKAKKVFENLNNGIFV